MLDARFVRENPQAVEEAMRNRNFAWDGARFAELDEARRADERCRYEGADKTDARRAWERAWCYFDKVDSKRKVG